MTRKKGKAKKKAAPRGAASAAEAPPESQAVPPADDDAGAPPPGGPPADSEQEAGSPSGGAPAARSGRGRPAKSKADEKSADSKTRAGNRDLFSEVVDRQGAKTKRPVGRPANPADKKKKEEKERKAVLDPELIEEAARASAKAQEGLLVALFGKTFRLGAYESDEDNLLVTGYRFWYRTYGIPFPPWAIFVFCQLAYFGTRLGDPENRKAVKEAMTKLTGIGRPKDIGVVKRAPERAETAPPGQGAPPLAPAAAAATATAPARQIPTAPPLPDDVKLHPDGHVGGDQPF